MSIQSIRGIHDILPTDTPKWQFIEATISKILSCYAYQEIRLPVLEKTELFKRAIGDVTDIVEKEMYSFVDKNDTSISLRPEGTAGCVRAAIQNGLLYNQVQKLWYMGSMFRRERPQKGRYRQFNQLGVETFGLSGYDIDAELILLSKHIFTALDIEDISLEINTLGSKLARQEYAQDLSKYLEQYKNELDTDSQKRLMSNPLRILDSKDSGTQKILQEAPHLKDYLSKADAQYFANLCDLLDELGLDYIINKNLVRGLDYYSHSVFEWKTKQLGSQNTICAGGRYNDLIEILSGKQGSAAGFAIGIERLLELYSSQHEFTVPQLADVYIVVADASLDVIKYTLKLSSILHAKLPNLKVATGSSIMSIKSQFKQAEKMQASYALIIEHERLVSTKKLMCKQLSAGGSRLTVTQQNHVAVPAEKNMQLTDIQLITFLKQQM